MSHGERIADQFNRSNLSSSLEAVNRMSISNYAIPCVYLLGLTLLACKSEPMPEITPTSPPVESVGAALQTSHSMELIGPANCALQLSKLRDCVIHPASFDSAVVPTAVPHRTEITRIKTGICSTSFPLQVSITSDVTQAATFSYLNNDRLVLRGPQGLQLSTLQVADASPWTPSLAVDKTCRVSLSITMNAIDIDSKSDAEAWIAGLEAKLLEKTSERDKYRDLLAFSAAYDLMHSLAQSFYGELTNDGMQRLRSAAIAARPGLQIAFDSCSQLPSADSDRLFELYEALVVAGDPASWQKPDGTTKSLADFLGPDAASIYQTVTQLEAQSAPALQGQYEHAFEQAVTDAQVLESQIALARSELAPWLNE